MSKESAVKLLHGRIAGHGTVPLVIAGPYRSGTSLVAAICEALGAHLGKELSTGSKHNPKGFHEEPRLARLCRQMYTQPWLHESMDRPRRLAALASWFSMEMAEAGSQKLIGGKHPILCLLVDDVLEAWGDRTRFVLVRRPVEEAIESLRRTNWPEWRTNPGSHEHSINLLAEARDRAIERLGERCLAVEYHQLLRRPDIEVERIATFLGPVEKKSLTKAAALVKPELYRTQLGRSAPDVGPADASRSAARTPSQ